MVLDECPKLTNDKKILSNAINVSTEWAKRSKKEFNNSDKNSEYKFSTTDRFFLNQKIFFFFKCLRL